MPRKPVPPCSLAIAAWAAAPAVSARSRRRAGTTPAPRTPRSGTPPRPAAAAVSTEPPPSHSYPINQTPRHHHQTKPKKKKIQKIHNSNNTEKCRQFEAKAKSGSERWQLWELGDEGDGRELLTLSIMDQVGGACSLLWKPWAYLSRIRTWVGLMVIRVEFFWFLDSNRWPLLSWLLCGWLII